jgi:hypothetical protein
MDTVNPLSTHNPRACECTFCLKHGAACVSDNLGNLDIPIRENNDLARYRQGSGHAELLICQICGVLVAVCHSVQGRIYAAVNSRSVDNAHFGGEVTVSPQRLPANDKIDRWQDIWFADVRIRA